MLELAILLQVWRDEYVEAAVIVGLLLVNASLGFVQEGRASTALAMLERGLAPSRPSGWMLAASAADIVIVAILALSGILMDALPWHVLAAVLAAAAGFALVLDQLRLALMTVPDRARV